MESPPNTHTEEQEEQEDQAPEPISGSPSDFLKNIVGKKVKVRIGSGVDYHGMSLLLFFPSSSSSSSLLLCLSLRDLRTQRPRSSSHRVLGGKTDI